MSGLVMATKRPIEGWRTLVDKLGGEDAINADFQEEDPAFTVQHIKSGKSVSDNGSVTALAQLWLAIQ